MVLLCWLRALRQKVDEQELRSCDDIKCDELGRLRLSEIQLGRIISGKVRKSLDARG